MSILLRDIRVLVFYKIVAYILNIIYKCICEGFDMSLYDLDMFCEIYLIPKTTLNDFCYNLLSEK